MASGRNCTTLGLLLLPGSLNPSDEASAIFSDLALSPSIVFRISLVSGLIVAGRLFDGVALMAPIKVGSRSALRMRKRVG
jgi:hypothetical protein